MEINYVKIVNNKTEMRSYVARTLVNGWRAALKMRMNENKNKINLPPVCLICHNL